MVPIAKLLAKEGDASRDASLHAALAQVQTAELRARAASARSAKLAAVGFVWDPIGKG
jgi:hypothetical protein